MSDSELVVLLTAFLALFFLACRLARAPDRRPARPVCERFSRHDPLNSTWSAIGCFPSRSKVDAAAAVHRLEGRHTFEQCQSAAQMRRRPFFALRNDGECLVIADPKALSLDGAAATDETPCDRTETLAPGLEVRTGGDGYHSAYHTMV